MLGDTLVLPCPAGNLTLQKINQDGYSSEYLLKQTLSEVRARVRHSKVKATATEPEYDRHNIEVVETVYATDEVPLYKRKVYMVFECKLGDSSVENIDGLCDYLIASADAKVIAMMGWNS